MANYIYAQCPNCKIKLKLDADKKYHDCTDCKFEFRLEDVQPLPANNPAAAQPKESIFGKFLRENKS